MKLGLVEHDGLPIRWADKSMVATIGGVVSVKGVLPFMLILMFPYTSMVVVAFINLGLDIYRTKKQANRWADIFRRLRFVLNGGYWRVQPARRVTQIQASVAKYKGQLTSVL